MTRAQLTTETSGGRSPPVDAHPVAASRTWADASATTGTGPSAGRRPATPTGPRAAPASSTSTTAHAATPGLSARAGDVTALSRRRGGDSRAGLPTPRVQKPSRRATHKQLCFWIRGAWMSERGFLYGQTRRKTGTQSHRPSVRHQGGRAAGNGGSAAFACWCVGKLGSLPATKGGIMKTTSRSTLPVLTRVIPRKAARRPALLLVLALLICLAALVAGVYAQTAAAAVTLDGTVATPGRPAASSVSFSAHHRHRRQPVDAGGRVLELRHRQPTRPSPR